MLNLGSRGRVIGAFAAAAIVAGVTTFSVWTASGSPGLAKTRAATALSATDINEVNAAASFISSKPGSVVSVVRAPGTQIWNAVAPGASTIDMTSAVMAHEFLLVICTDNPTQTQYSSIGGPSRTTPPPVIGEADVVIDEVTGQVLTSTYIPKGKVNPFASQAAVANLGAPVTMTLQ